MNYNKEITSVPERYRRKTDGGRIEKIFYNTELNGERLEKHAYVYLPYGYSNDEKYDIFYFMHGGGDSAESYFFGEGREGLLKNMLDGMIKEKLIRPIIVVTPTFYTGKKDHSVQNAHTHVARFHHEFVNDLLPVVESDYSTFAPTIDREGFEKSREHRMFGGFSMGSANTWYMFINCLDFFKYYMPISGDCWAVAEYGGFKKPYDTAKALASVVENSKYKDEFFIYAVTGTNDVAYKAMESQINAMADFEEFKLSCGDNTGNIAWNVKEGGIHRYESVEQYLYTALPLIFGAND